MYQGTTSEAQTDAIANIVKTSGRYRVLRVRTAPAFMTADDGPVPSGIPRLSLAGRLLNPVSQIGKQT